MDDKAGPPPNVFGFTTPSNQASLHNSSPQLLSNANYTTRSFASTDFPSASNSAYNNPFSSNSPNSYTTQPNIRGGYPSTQPPNRASPSSSPSVARNVSTPTPTISNIDIVQEELDSPPALGNKPQQEEIKSSPQIPLSPSSSLSANYSFIAKLNSATSRDAASTNAPGGGDAPVTNADAARADVWAMLSQLSKK